MSKLLIKDTNMSSETKYDAKPEQSGNDEDTTSTIYMSNFKAKMFPSKTKFNQHQLDRQKYYKKPLQPPSNLNEANRKLLNKILQKHKELVDQEKLKKEIYETTNFQRPMATNMNTSYKYFGSNSINNVSNLLNGHDNDSGRHSMAESPSANNILPSMISMQNDKKNKNEHINPATATGSFTSKCIFKSGNEITFTPQPKHQQQHYQQLTPNRTPINTNNRDKEFLAKNNDSAEENANKIFNFRGSRSKSINLSEL